MDFTAKHGHVDNRANHSLSANRFVSGLIFLSLPSSASFPPSFSTPIQVHGASSAHQRHLRRLPEAFTKYTQR